MHTNRILKGKTIKIKPHVSDVIPTVHWKCILYTATFQEQLLCVTHRNVLIYTKVLPLLNHSETDFYNTSWIKASNQVEIKLPESAYLKVSNWSPFILSELYASAWLPTSWTNSIRDAVRRSGDFSVSHRPPCPPSPASQETLKPLLWEGLVRDEFPRSKLHFALNIHSENTADRQRSGTRHSRQISSVIPTAFPRGRRGKHNRNEKTTNKRFLLSPTTELGFKLSLV